jgi:hypothetical protein
MPEEIKRSTVIIPEGMQEIARANDRSLAKEAKVAMEAHVRKYAGNSRDRRTARRKAARR